MLAADTHPLITGRVKKYLTAATGMDDTAWRAWQIQWFGTGLAALEQRLAAEPQTGVFCHGDTPTMADICLASIVEMVRIFKITIPDNRRSTGSWKLRRPSGVHRSQAEPSVGAPA